MPSKQKHEVREIRGFYTKLQEVSDSKIFISFFISWAIFPWQCTEKKLEW
jgi:hypothetical protein